MDDVIEKLQDEQKRWIKNFARNFSGIIAIFAVAMLLANLYIK